MNHHAKSCGLPDDHFKCTHEKCTYSTGNLKNVNEHVKTMHSPVKKYKCKFCKETFKYRDKQIKHIKDVHNEEM